MIFETSSSRGKTTFAVCVFVTACLVLFSACETDEAPAVTDGVPAASSEQTAPAEPVRQVAQSDTTGGVRGIVQDAEEEPLAQANLFFADLEMGAATGGDGSYLIRGIPSGTHTLTASHRERRKEVEVEIFADSLVSLDVTLE